MPVHTPSFLLPVARCFGAAPALAPHLTPHAKDQVGTAPPPRAAAAAPRTPLQPTAAPLRLPALSLAALQEQVDHWTQRLGRDPELPLWAEQLLLAEPDQSLAHFAVMCGASQVSPLLQKAALPALQALLTLRDAAQRARLLTQLGAGVLDPNGAQRPQFLALMAREAHAKPAMLVPQLAVLLAGGGALLEHPHVRHYLSHRANTHDGRGLTSLVNGVQAWTETGGAASLEDWLAWPNHAVLQERLAGRIRAQTQVCEVHVQDWGTPQKADAEARQTLASLRALHGLFCVMEVHARGVQHQCRNYHGVVALSRYKAQAFDATRLLQRWLRRVHKFVPSLHLPPNLDLEVSAYDTAALGHLEKAAKRHTGVTQCLLQLLHQSAKLMYELSLPVQRSPAEPVIFGGSTGAVKVTLQQFYNAEILPMQQLLQRVGPALMGLQGERIKDEDLVSPDQLHALLSRWLFAAPYINQPDFAPRFARLQDGLRDPSVLFRFVAWMDKLDQPHVAQTLRAALAAQLMDNYHGFRHDNSPQLQAALKRAGRHATALRAQWEAGAHMPALSVLDTPLPRTWQVRDTADLDAFLHGAVDVDSCQNPTLETKDNAALVGRISDGSKRLLCVVDAHGVLQARTMFRMLTPKRGAPVLLISVPYVAQHCSEIEQAALHALLLTFGQQRAQALGLRWVRGLHHWHGTPHPVEQKERLHSAASVAPDYWDERDGPQCFGGAVEIYVGV